MIAGAGRSIGSISVDAIAAFSSSGRANRRCGPAARAPLAPAPHRRCRAPCRRPRFYRHRPAARTRPGQVRDLHETEHAFIETHQFIKPHVRQAGDKCDAITDALDTANLLRPRPQHDVGDFRTFIGKPGHGRWCTFAQQEKGRTSFLKKRSKKLLLLRLGVCGKLRAKKTKVFWFFFSKKNCFFLTVFITRFSPEFREGPPASHCLCSNAARAVPGRR